MHILIADDYAETAASLSDLLELVALEETTTAVALDGAQAVQAARERRPDVALLDIAMPGVGGLEAGNLIRGMFGRNVVLVAMSGQHEHVLAARKSGNFDHVFLKPLNIEQLMGIIATLRRTGV